MAPLPTLITGAAGSGKTGQAISRIVQAIRSNPFAPIWVVLPNERQVAGFQIRLLAALNRDAGIAAPGALFNVTCLAFYNLYGRLLALTGQPQRRISSVTQLRVLLTVIRTLAEQKQLTYFADIAESPGLIQLAAAFIEELKRARITPEQFEQAAHTDQAQDRDLALIYSRYQDTLKDNNLVDIEGEGWLALARLEESAAARPLGIDLLVIDGFDQFNRVQLELLGLLAARVPQMVMTLTFQPERAETAHRRFARTYEQLNQLVRWQVTPMPLRSGDRASVRLTRLSEALFERAREGRIDDSTDADALTLIEAPDPRREVEAALRRVKRELLDGALPESIAIIARDIAAYRPYLIDRAAAYGIPIAGDVATPLIENPAILSLLAAIDLAASRFPRRPTIDLLRDPYLSIPEFPADQVDQLDRLSRQQVVIAGDYQWLAAIKHYRPLKTNDVEDESADPGEPNFDREDLTRRLTAFFDRITPPASATAHAYALWIERLIGIDPDAEAALDSENDDSPAPTVDTLGLIANIRRWAGDPAIIARDLEALASFKKALADLLAAYDLLNERGSIEWSTFRGDLGSLTETAQIQGGSPLPTGSQVLIGSVFSLRGLAFDSVYVLGLSEGQFPARDPEPILYLDVERQTINAGLAADRLALNTHAERADEGSLFYELTALAHRRLILLRSYSAPDGTPWPPSIYWTAVQAAVPVVPIHLSMNRLMTVSEAASLPEALIATAHDLSQPLIDSESAIDSFGVITWLADHPAYFARWRNIHRARRIARDRVRNIRNEYNGHLQTDLAKAAANRELSPDHLWSAAQFNDYGACPYGFFAKRLLNIEALEEPEPGLSAAIRGSLLHEILEKTYQQIAAEHLTITAAHQPRALAILESVGQAVCDAAPGRYGFRPDALWAQAQADLAAELRQLLSLDFSEKSPLAKFLGGEREPVAQESVFAQAILTGAAGVITIRGRIDRIDRSPAGLLVIDYKSGAAPFNEGDIREGRSVQTLIYLHVVDQTRTTALGLPISSAFWHTSNRKTSGVLPSIKDEALITDATDALHRRVIAARDGIFPGEPSRITAGKCTSYCAFSALCRVR